MSADPPAPERSGVHPDTDLLDLVQDLDAVVWEMDLRTMRFTFVSDRVADMFGRPAAAWTDFGFWTSLIHPEERERMAAYCTAEIAAGRDHDFEYRTVRPDGRVVHVRDLVRLVYQGGELTRLRGLMVDVTARRHAEAVQAALRRVATAVAAQPVADVGAAVVQELSVLAGGAEVTIGPDGTPAVRPQGPLPPGFGETVGEFARLLELARANDAAVGALRSGEEAQRRLAAEREALVRIARAVAEDRPGDEVFALVADATAEALGLDIVVVFEYVGDEIALRGLRRLQAHAEGDQLPAPMVGALQDVRRTGRAARLSAAELSGDDAVGHAARAEGVVSAAIVPVTVAGAVWGCIAVASRTAELPPDTEMRLDQFVRGAATAVSHADARARLVQMATTDALTGLANHRAFQERLRVEVARAQRHARPLALVLIDLDGFKLVNDAHGHEAGDRALAEVARRLEELAGPGDLLARTGGDEFAWIVAESDAMGGYASAERARAAIAIRPVVEEMRVDASAGVCGLEEATGPDDLLRLADGALYWAKAHGRGVTFRYTPDVVHELSATERADRLARQRTLAGLRALARAVDAKDHSTREHSERVAELAALLAGSLGWGQDEVIALREAALLHDVGKIGVPDAVLFKAGPLTHEEFALIRPHAALGATIAAEVLAEVQVAWIRGHHERWDGQGYPDRLLGETIPVGARLLALADAWDVMTHVRTYKEARDPVAAFAECRAHAATQFWPDAVRALEEVVAAGRVPVASPV